MKSSEKMTILLVEDQAIIAMSEAAMLKKNGYNVITANTGEQAIKTVEENTAINLILMDIDLGKGIDGTEAAQKILKNNNIPVLFLSNHTEKEIVEKTEKITSYGYVVKNSGETVLIASIKMAFKLFEAHKQVLESEVKLLESDRRFHTLEKQIDDVIWTMDMNFRFTYISPSVEKMLGYSVDEISKMSIQEYLTPESAQTAINLLAEEINDYLRDKREGNIVTAIIHQIRKDKTIVPCEIRARFLLDVHNNPVGIIGVTRDVSERQKSREAILESKKALDLALEGAHVGFWDSNYITGKVIRSEIWASMLGYTLDEVENTSEFWRNHIHPEDFDRVMTEVKKHEQGEIENFSIEHRILTKSGNYKWILDWGKVFERTENGEPIRAMGVHIDIDNKVKTEKILLETNKTLNLALEGANIGLWDQDFNTNTVKRTENWAKMLGYQPDEIKNDLKVWKSLIHPDDLESALKAAEEHEAGLTENYKVQHRLKCKDGSYKWVLNFGRISERDSEGKPKRAVGIHLDVDEKVRTEESLIESEQRLRYSLDSTNDGIWELRLPSNEFFANESFYKQLGENHSQLIEQYETLRNYIHPDDLDMIEEKFLETIKNKSSFSAEYRIKRKDGSYIWVFGRGKVTQCDSDGNPIRISGANTDITKNKLAQDNLKKSQQMLQNVLEQFPGVVFWKDRDSNYLGCNQAFATGAGLEYPEQIVGKTDFDLPWAKTEAENYRKDDKQVINSAKPKLNIEETQHQSGDEIKWFNTNKVPLLDSYGNIIGILGTSNDITERKKAENELRNNERKLTSIFKAAPIGIGVLSNRVILQVNDKMSEILGYKIEEMLGQKTRMFYRSEKEFEEIGKIIYAQSNLGLSGNIEAKFVTKAGIEIDVLISYAQLDYPGYENGLTFALQDISDRKTIETELRNNQNTLNSIFNATPIGIGVVSNRILQRVNKRIGEITGYSWDEVIGNSSRMFYPSDEEFDFVGSEIIKLIKEKGSGSIETKMKCKDGKIIDVQLSVAPLDPNNITAGVTFTTLDITERKKAEIELKESEDKLSSIIKVSPIGIGVTVNRVLMEVNEYICNSLGYSKSELLGKSARMLYPSDEEFEFVGAEKYKQIEKAGIGTVETKWKRKDGKTIDVLLSSTPLNLKDISGGVTFTALDITDRKINDAMIKESEANLIAVINHREEAIWSIDNDYNYIIVNDVFKSDYKLAFDVDLRKGLNAIDILSGELLEFWKPKYDKALSGEVVKFEFTQNIQGQIRDFEMTLSPIISDTKVLGVSGISRDITKRKEMDEEILQRKEELERFEKIVIGRELKMIELKEKIIELEAKLKEFV